MNETKLSTEKTAVSIFSSDKLPTLIAITTLILAVCATLASFKAAGYGNRMVLMQSQASDQWSYYQAKSIKENIYQVQRDLLVIQLQEAAYPQNYQKQIDEYDKELLRYKQEKNDIQNEAKKFESERDIAREFNGQFGQALIFLQVGILLSSLASINKIHYYWYMGVFVGVVGIILFGYSIIKSL